MVQKIQSGGKAEANGNVETHDDYIGSGDDHAMSFDPKDVVHLAVQGVTFDIRDKAQNGIYSYQMRHKAKANQVRSGCSIPY